MTMREKETLEDTKIERMTVQETTCAQLLENAQRTENEAL